MFRRVTLPLLAPGFVASAALSLISFDEVVISLFITGPRLKTLPVEIFDYVESRTDPMTAAVSVMLIVATLFVVFLVERTLGMSRRLANERHSSPALSMEQQSKWKTSRCGCRSRIMATLRSPGRWA